MNRLSIMVMVGTVVFACGTKEQSKARDEISGSYAREYSYKVINPESGTEIGITTVRDTIFIRSVEGEYEVSNHESQMDET